MVRIVTCTDCGKWLNNGEIYGHGLDNVCAYHYAVRVQHPSVRMKVGK
jgi:hypothetical protein